MIDSVSLGLAGVFPITKLEMEDEGSRRIDVIPVTHTSKYKLEFCSKIYLYRKMYTAIFQLDAFILEFRTVSK